MNCEIKNSIRPFRKLVKEYQNNSIQMEAQLLQALRDGDIQTVKTILDNSPTNINCQNISIHKLFLFMLNFHYLMIFYNHKSFMELDCQI